MRICACIQAVADKLGDNGNLESAGPAMLRDTKCRPFNPKKDAGPGRRSCSPSSHLEKCSVLRTSKTGITANWPLPVDARDEVRQYLAMVMIVAT